MTGAANINNAELTAPMRPPVLDRNRLAKIPITPPARPQLLQQVSRMELILKPTMKPEAVKKAEQIAESKTVKEVQAAAVGSLYNDEIQSALLLGMKAVKKDPSDLTGWNNLAAILNMSGLEEYAIPILQHCIQELPQSSMLLNNMGQAYMGLGELSKAKQYLRECLALDDLHPEANRSMALLYFFDNDAENSLKHFEKELQVAQRRSTLAHLVRSGKRKQINLAAIRKQKMQLDGAENKDYFSEIGLNKFKIPDPPENSKASAKWKADIAGLMRSLIDEVSFWREASKPTSEERRAEGKMKVGIYADLVNELIRDLGNQYSPLTGIVRKGDGAYLTGLHYEYSDQDQKTICPEPPMEPGQAAVLFPLYEKKCCDLKTPLIDRLMSKYNSFMSARIKEAQSNYKQYINGLINAVQLNPTPSNKRWVYGKVESYFSFVYDAIQSYLILDPYMTCKTGANPDNDNTLIESARNVDVRCPSWLKMDLNLQVAKLKADCTQFGIEGELTKVFHAGFEKQFKTGTSTLYAGASLKDSFTGIASASLKQQFFISFDQNDQFSDLGMRGSSGIDLELGSGVVGVEAGYTLSVNSGFNSQVKSKIGWVKSF